ncbi:spore coat protein U domain-containing protein [Janthinobacterium sp. B9-8]|uniref:spore coat protein U domain-containing protein n=1 Tax=Janthinobacterium sp. B9-8 TaxID=1236179 RepID=UPI00061D1E1D|nr:spore coat protein U domain-containing protein [Janthinobacterium sp. B9-8]AMC34460.1 hypothetical protein VN23_07520 [Janthinobacterium sp. B9-8]
MKKMILATLFASATFPAIAANVNVHVLGKVLPVCTFVSPSDVTMTIPDMTPGIVENKQTTADISFWCSKGTSYTVSMNDGLNGADGKKNIKLASGDVGDLIEYDLTVDKTSGVGEGGLKENKVMLTATVAGDAYQNAKAGDYADTVVLTVAP